MAGFGIYKIGFYVDRFTSCYKVTVVIAKNEDTARQRFIKQNPESEIAISWKIA